MELTVGDLRKIIADLPDDVILAHLGYGNSSFSPFLTIKRLLLLKGDHTWGDRTFLTINGMGSHFTENGEHKHLSWTGKHWDEDTLAKEETRSTSKE